MKPMLAKKCTLDNIPQGDYLYELKWDGIRAVFYYSYGELTIKSRSGRDITDRFPELVKAAPGTFRHEGIFDGEIVVFDGPMRPDFARVTSRLHLKKATLEDLERNPVRAMLFDITLMDGDITTDQPLEERQALLSVSIVEGPQYEISVGTEDGDALMGYAIRNQLEGVMAKRKGSTYNPGRRTNDWLKVKLQHKEQVMVVGFTEGKGKRGGYFGSLIIQDMDCCPVGNVGTGFTDKQLAEYMELFKIGGYYLSTDGKYFVLEHPMPAEVKGMKKNSSGAIREPVFVKFLGAK